MKLYVAKGENMSVAQLIYKGNKLNNQLKSTAGERITASINRQFSDKSDIDTSSNVLSAEEQAQKFTKDMREQIKHFFDPSNGMTDEQKRRYERKIRAKIEAGEELTVEEMRYIQINMPDLYPLVIRIQMQRKALEENLKHCKSKEEAQEVYEQALSNVSDKDPAANQLIAAYNDVMKEFKESDIYAALPQKKDLEKRYKNSDKEIEHNVESEDKADKIEELYFSEDSKMISVMDVTA